MTPGFEIIAIREHVGRALSQRIARLSADYPTHTINVVAGGARGVDKNTLIADVQAGRRRNPWYLSAEAKEALRFVFRPMWADPAKTMSQLQKAGQVILDAIRLNVARQKNKSGSGFQALTPNYAAYKRRKFGFVTPILRATGDLLDGLRVVIDRR